VPIISIVAYDDRAMSVVLAAKERGERRAKEFIMLAISTGIARLDFKRPEDSLRIIIPIPSSKGAIRRRGEDFIHSLAKEVLKTVAIADHRVVLLPILRWKRVIKDQSELTMRERIANLADSLAVDERRLEKELHSWRPRYRRYHTLLSECAHRSRVSLPATPREGSEHLL